VTGLQRSFQIHAAVWFATNVMLFVIWLITGAGFPWFLFPALGWGIGLAAHATVAYTHPPSANDELEPGDGYRSLGR
jgi:hypothetical protein